MGTSFTFFELESYVNGCLLR